MTRQAPDYAIPLVDRPISALAEMVAIEQEWLGWSPEQTRQFCSELLGKSNPRTLTPVEWIKLTYAMRAIGYGENPINLQEKQP